MAAPMAAGLGPEIGAVFDAYSPALGIMALLGLAIGPFNDANRGHAALCASKLIRAGGLVLLAVVASLWTRAVGWAVIGAGMTCGPYDAAFANLARQHGAGARAPSPVSPCCVAVPAP